MYLDDLAPFPEPVIVAAFARYARSGKSFFPTVPELFKAIADAAPGSSPDEALGQLRRKICYRYAPTRPDAELTADEAALVHELGQTPARLALMPPKDLDWWLRQTYGPAWARGQGQQGGDALLGTAHRAALVAGERREGAER